MFDSGTKMVVLASSHRGSLGVKKGSLAFFCQDVGNGNVLYDEDNKVFFAAAELVFYRYGFEKKDRCERKQVLVLLPKISANYGDTYGQVAKLSRRIQSGRAEMWNKCRSAIGVSAKVPAVMLAPVGLEKDDLVTCNIYQRMAWMEAIMSEQEMSRWIMEALQEQHISNSKHPEMNMDITFMLRDIAGDRHQREATCMTTGSEDGIRRMVEAIQLAKIIRIKNNFSRQVEYHYHRCRHEGHYRVLKDREPNPIAVCCNAYTLLFRTPYYNDLKRHVLLTIGHEVEPFFQEPETVRDCLLGLSSCLLRTGKIDGKKAMAIGQ